MTLTGTSQGLKRLSTPPISLNKRLGVYLKFRLKRGALIGRRAPDTPKRGRCLCSFPFHQMVSEKFSSKNSKFYIECMAHSLFCHTAIWQSLMADIFFNISHKELKIAQIAQINQLFQLLHLVHINGHGFCVLMSRKNVNNDVSKDSPIHLGVHKVLSRRSAIKSIQMLEDVEMLTDFSLLFNF